MVPFYSYPFRTPSKGREPVQVRPGLRDHTPASHRAVILDLVNQSPELIPTPSFPTHLMVSCWGMCSRIKTDTTTPVSIKYILPHRTYHHILWGETYVLLTSSLTYTSLPLILQYCIYRWKTVGNTVGERKGGYRRDRGTPPAPRGYPSLTVRTNCQKP